MDLIIVAFITACINLTQYSSADSNARKAQCVQRVSKCASGCDTRRDVLACAKEVHL